MPQLLLTGSTGFVGRALRRRFETQGWMVLGVGRTETDSPGHLRHDLAHALPQTPGFTPNVVIHAAALAAPWGRRRAFHRSNVLATENVIDYCRRHGCPRLIFISSASVYYERRDQLNISESTPYASPPINRYAATKIIGERLVSAYEGEHVILRPRAVYGPDDTVLFPRILRAARAGKLPLLVRDAGPAMGDLIYIDNLVDYILAAAVAPRVEGSYILTNGEPVAIVPFLLSVFDRLGVPHPTRKVNVRTAMRLGHFLEVFHSIFLPWIEPAVTRFGVEVFAHSKTFDVRRAVAAFGPPRISNEEGVDRFVEWVKREQPY